MSKCKVCGFRLADGMKKCPMCGAMRGSTRAGELPNTIHLPKYLCPSCKAEIIGEHRYCPACMKELSEAAKKADVQEQGSNDCIQCGVSLPVGAKFCHECGAKQESHCTHCGATIMPNAKFCNECGAKQNSLQNTKPTKDNATNASGEKKETPLEVFEYEVRGGKYILKGVKDNSLTDIVIPRVFSEIEGWVDKRWNEWSDGSTTCYYEDWISVFGACKKLKNVTIPNTITKIGTAAFFYCENLTNINIPDSVIEIGDRAFDFCKSLIKITIPNSVTKIGDFAFGSCESLTNITIPNSVTKIGDCAFDGCRSLTNIIIPNSVIEIGPRAFMICSSLKNITISKSITEIGRWAFYRCKNLMNIAIPNSVTRIGFKAFSECINLTNITIPNSVTRIGEEAFSYCKSLRSITIPKSVKIIGENIFSNCNSLKNVSFENPNITKSNIKCMFGDSPSFTEVKIGNKVVKVSELRLR